MFKNLKAEMARCDYTNEFLSQMLSINAKTVSNKMTGKAEWTRKEMFLIKKRLFPNCTVDYLFDLFDTE